MQNNQKLKKKYMIFSIFVLNDFEIKDAVTYFPERDGRGG